MKGNVLCSAVPVLNKVSRPQLKRGNAGYFIFSILISAGSFIYSPSSYADLQLWQLNTPNTGSDEISLIEKANAEMSKVLKNQDLLGITGMVSFDFFGSANSGQGKYSVSKVLKSAVASTVKYVQVYKGIPVVGMEAMVHFDASGAVHDLTQRQVVADFSETPAISAAEALQILQDRYSGEEVVFDVKPELRVFVEEDNVAKLVYHALTKTTAHHLGQEVFMDAENGNILVEADRNIDMEDLLKRTKVLEAMGKIQKMVNTLDASPEPIEMPTEPIRGKRTVYNADTETGRSLNGKDGYPISLDTSLYQKVLEDGKAFEGVDRSAVNAYRGTGKVYDYYNKNFGYKSFDNKDTRIMSAVHVGAGMNNAFWSSEDQIMAFGDGDGKRLIDLTYGLDVTAHEMTHGVTGNTAKLVYAAESGALNESYSDFFGRMVDYDQNSWDIGAAVMAPGSNRRAIRNMKDPTEFKQPDRMDSKLKISTNQPCTSFNDRCGVHGNSGIPNRAGYLVVMAIGKEKAEKLYFNVLTRRLTATSNFHDARVETEKECALELGAGSADCKAVSVAFDTVQM